MDLLIPVVSENGDRTVISDLLTSWWDGSNDRLKSMIAGLIVFSDGIVVGDELVRKVNENW